MILSDASIRAAIESGRITLDPYDPALVQPSSVDLRLGADFLEAKPGEWVDTREPVGALQYRQVTANDTDGFVLAPGMFALGATIERIAVPPDLVGILHGKSSLGRMGLTVHVTAGYIDSGFEGEITLELANLSPHTLVLYPGMPIAQVSFTALDRPCERPYGSAGLGSKYQGQSGPVVSQYWRNG